MEPNERMQSEGNLNDHADGTYCSQCQSDTVIFDMVSSEFVCSTCGCVANDKFFNGENNNGLANPSEYSDRSRTGMPESLAIHHKGLSTLIGMGDTDARGKALEPAQRKCRDCVHGTTGLNSMILYLGIWKKL
jgi:transcription initiation factor TFIIB